MADWAEGMEGRNYTIARHMDIRNLQEMLAALICILMVAGVLGFHLWIRVRMVDMGYETQELLKRENTALRLHGELILEEEYLKRPARIEAFAVGQLGMAPIRLEQILPGRIRSVEAGGETTLVLAESQPASGASGKTSNDN